MRELRGIGPGIEARLRELVETGDIAELAELERELAPGLVGLGRYLGLSAKRSVEIARALGVRTAEELRAAAAAGRLRSRAGHRARRPRRGCSTRSPARPSRGRGAGCCSTARGSSSAASRARWTASRPATCGAGATPASSSRWSAPRRIRRRCSRASPRCRRSSRWSSRGTRRAVGVTVEGVPVELVVAEPRALRHRARARDRRAGVRRRARAAPGRAGRGRRLSRRSASPGVRRSCARSRSGASRRRSWSPTTSAATCTATRRGRTGGRASRRWGAPPSSAATSTSRSATTRPPSAPSAGSPPTTSAARPRRSRPRTSCWRRSASCAGSSATSCPTAGSTFPTTSSPSSTGCRRACTAASGCRGAEMTQARRGGAAQPARALPQPSDGPAHHPPARRTRSTSSACSRVALEHGVALEVNGLPARLDLSGEHVRDALRAGVRIVCSTDAHSVRGLANMALAVHTARRGWATPATCSTPGRCNRS